MLGLRLLAATAIIGALASIVGGTTCFLNSAEMCCNFTLLPPNTSRTCGGQPCLDVPQQNPAIVQALASPTNYGSVSLRGDGQHTCTILNYFCNTEGYCTPGSIRVQTCLQTVETGVACTESTPGGGENN
jgi:hypothetical protein